MSGSPKVYLECKFDKMYLDWGIKIGKTRSAIKDAPSYKYVIWIDWIIVCALQFLPVPAHPRDTNTYNNIPRAAVSQICISILQLKIHNIIWMKFI